MLFNITILIVSLVGFNFLLLKLSCNKTSKQKFKSKAPVVLRTQATIELDTQELAPTGS